MYNTKLITHWTVIPKQWRFVSRSKYDFFHWKSPPWQTNGIHRGSGHWTRGLNWLCSWLFLRHTYAPNTRPLGCFLATRISPLIYNYATQNLGMANILRTWQPVHVPLQNITKIQWSFLWVGNHQLKFCYTLHIYNVKCTVCGHIVSSVLL